MDTKDKTLRAEIIGFDSGWGCRDHGCEDGPSAAPMDRILHTLRHLGVDARWRGALNIKFLARHDAVLTKEKALPLVVEGLKRLHNHVVHTLREQRIPVVIGGDHSSAIGTWAAAAAAVDAREKFGLIWFDAHLDAHTEETSHEGKWGGWWHGQPLPVLLGLGNATLGAIGGTGAKLSPDHISFIGVRSFEPAEEAFVKQHGIRVYDMEEVRKRGLAAVYKEALDRAIGGTAGFGITIDLDCFDINDAPGVGSPEAGGLDPSDVMGAVHAAARHPRFCALEIAEFNPHNDKDGRTAALVKKIIDNVFARAGD